MWRIKTNTTKLKKKGQSEESYIRNINGGRKKKGERISYEWSNFNINIKVLFLNKKKDDEEGINEKESIRVRR